MGKKRIKIYVLIPILIGVGVVSWFTGKFIGTKYKEPLGEMVTDLTTDTSIIPPKDPPYPSDSAEDYARFDNDTSAEMNEKECVLTYSDGTTKTATRCTDDDIRFLNKHLDNADISWINLHIGTCLIVYTIEDDDVTYEYYQHLVDTEYVFLYKK